MRSEDDLVATLTRSWQKRNRLNPRILMGVGDDCAVVKGDIAGHYFLLKTDAVVEHRHFTPETAPRKIGRKALARVLSDIAAMGGVPLEAMVTLGVPEGIPWKRLSGIYAGITALAEAYGVSLVGGETTRTSELMLSVSARGECRGYPPVLRRGAQLGDAILVTGRLGGSLRGRHLSFTPRLREGQWLAQRALATAMMDLSDGLATDLPRLLRASHAAAEVHLASIPRTPNSTVLQACCDGEDYELLITVPPARMPEVLHWPFKTPVTPIGSVIRWSSGRPEVEAFANLEGYDHLRQR